MAADVISVGVDGKASERVRFNLRNLTAQQMHDFFKANANADYPTMAAIFAVVCESVPAEWGDARDPATYLSLPFFGEFRDLIRTFVDHASTEAKN